MKLVVAMPTRGQIHENCVHTLLRLSARCVREGLRFSFMPDRGAPCYLARDSSVRRFLADPDATHLLFLDDDVEVQKDALWRLVVAPHPIVAIAYRKKFMVDEAYRGYVVSSRDWHQPDEAGFVDVDRVGAGVLMVRRDVLLAMAERFQELAYTTSDGLMLGLFRESFPDFVSEDYSFCDRARAAGYRVKLMVDAETTHFGLGAWRGNLAEEWPCYVEEARSEPTRDPERMVGRFTARVPKL